MKVKEKEFSFNIVEFVEDIKRLGHTEDWIAEQMKVSRECVNRLKNGVTQHPRLDTYYKLVMLHQECFPRDH